MDTSNEPLDQEQFQSATNPGHQALQQEAFDARLRSVASWFYWIVAFSIVNSILVMLDVRLNFSLGLGITRIVDGVILDLMAIDDAADGGFSVYQVVGWIVNLLTLALFAFFGYMLTQYRAAWALWVGVILYGLDSLIFIFLFQIQSLSVAFHALVLYRLSEGFTVLKKIKQLGATRETLAA